MLASSSNEPTPPENAAEGTSSAGEGDGGQPSGEDNIQETQGNRSNNTGSEAMYDDPME